MPKVVINNTKGLFQKTGGGLALFGGGVESISVDSTTGSDNPIAATTSLALVTSGTDTHATDLPTIADVEVGHTILIASIGTNDLVIEPQGDSSETINGQSSITTGQNTAVLCVKATSTTWIAINVGV